MPRGFHWLIAAQFCSALADNALLIVTLAVLHDRQLAPWLAPMLKFGFTLAYVLLAPFIGPLADAMPKGRLMAWMNGLKLVGAAALLAGLHPVAAFALVGLGAAAYAPAKYGLVTEIVPPRQLVAANGWLEVAVVVAVLLGTVCGGLLVSQGWLRGPAAALAGAIGAGPLQVSLAVVMAVYLLAALLNRGVPVSGARYATAARQPGRLLGEFRRDNRRLWQDADGGLSLAVTTIFWGVGATLQFIVLRWAGEALGLPLSQAAVLQGVVALGVIVGATIAGRWVPLAAARRMLGFGVLLGLAMPALAAVHTLALAVPLLVVAGAAGGLLVVPLNALLQHRGCQLLSAGRSIAVQGFNENASVLAMLAGYAALVALDVPLRGLMTGFGLAIAGAITLLWLQSARRPSVSAADEQPAAARPRSG
ncbi:MAG: lysophospholipid transporter LplT [Rubrivivax sp.]|nr:lysophospholipid transporter LplT [Rubrivivax sp.]